jgi:hypothetical protein
MPNRFTCSSMTIWNLLHWKFLFQLRGQNIVAKNINGPYTESGIANFLECMNHFKTPLHSISCTSRRYVLVNLKVLEWLRVWLFKRNLKFSNLQIINHFRFHSLTGSGRIDLVKDAGIPWLTRPPISCCLTRAEIQQNNQKQDFLYSS